MAQLPFLNNYGDIKVLVAHYLLASGMAKIKCKKLRWLVSHLTVVVFNSLSTLESSTDTVDSDFAIKY